VPTLRPAATLAAALTAAACLVAAAGAPRTIETHVGVPGFLTLGLSHKELMERFPGAAVEPFAGQDDALTVKIPRAGVSCMVVGEAPAELRVASIGFNLDGEYQGVSEGAFRTDRGLAKGSTVNDLLEAYGRPADIAVDRAGRRALRGNPGTNDDAVPRLYLYRSEDGGVTTSFVVQHNRVVRVLINAIAPLEKHVLKVRPRE
jgi:hypothetical protein